MPSNNDRVRSADKILTTYAHEKGDPYAEIETTVIDLLTDLRHHADAYGLDWRLMIDTSRRHYDAEQGE